jgi:hypothetical protein
MLKFILTISLIAAAFFANMAVPQVATVTFAPDTTLQQVVDLLNQHNTWADDDIFITNPEGDGFFYIKGSMSVAERQEATWVNRRTSAHLDKIPVPQKVTDCIASRTCPVTITRVTLLNPPAAILNAPIVAATETHRELHPFFQHLLAPGRP